MKKNRAVSPAREQTQKPTKASEKSFHLFKLFMHADGVDIFLMVLGSICSVANGLAQPIMALLFGSLVHTFSTTNHQHMLHEISKLSFKLLCLAIGVGIAAFLQVLCWTITGERQASRLQVLYFKSLLRQEIGFFDTEITVGQVVSSTSNDAITIRNAISQKIGKCIQYMSTFLGGILLAFLRGWLLSLLLVSMIPSLMIVGGIMARTITKMSTCQQSASSEAGDVVEETVGAIKTVSSLTAEKEATLNYAKKLERAYAFSERQGLVSGLGIGAVTFIVFSDFGLAIWYGSKLIIEKGDNGGQVVSILVALVYGGMAMGQFSACINAIAEGQASAKKILEVIQRKPKINTDDSTCIVRENIKGEIEFRDVYFKYPARPNVEVFSGLSLHIPSGTTVALVGKSGSGKSTMINLLERFYDPEAGQVLIDGVNVKKLQLRWLREKIGLVSQEPVLFDTTIRENIAYGNRNATEDEIRKALDSSSASTFINDLPMGLDTMVGKCGAQLSGGQKQRIAIARVILKDPRIFLLDEVTSALDTKTEKATYDAILKIASKRTTVIITHNLLSIENVDSIAVMHQGKVVERGTHDELLRDQDGYYSQLIFSQRKVEVENSKGMPVSPNGNEQVHIFECFPSSQSSGTEVSSNGVHSVKRSSSVMYHHSCKENEMGSFKKPGSIARLAKLSKDEFPFLLIGTNSSVVHGAAIPIFGLLFATAIASFYEPPSMRKKDTSHWALMFVILGIVTFLVILLQNYCFRAASSRLIKRLSLLSFEKIIHQDICWFEDPSNSSGAVGARISANASALDSLMIDGFALLVQNISTVAAGLYIAFFANWILALILVTLFSMVSMQTFLETKLLRRFTATAELSYVQQSQVASDATGSIKTVVSIGAENKMVELYQKKSATKSVYWICLGSSINYGVSQFEFYFTSALCFYLGAMLVQHKKATVEDVFKVYLTLVATAAGIAEASGMTLDAKKASNLAYSICNILDSKQKDVSGDEMDKTIQSMVGDIEFKNVSFSYPSRPSVQILKGVSLSISAGQTVVFVGESGNGKSTLINLVERFYDVDSGCILLDAIEIQNYKLKWLRQQIGLVSQEPILFNETIRCNIAYGKQDLTKEDEIVAAAKLANAHNFISALPQGYDTSVGQYGVQLSGGQKQRIAIARAIVKNPKILLLDEATSSLDPESEKAVQKALNQVMLSKTTMVVTHRLSTIRVNDTIAVLRNGMIVEKGTHDELVKITDGAYSSLFAHHLYQST